MSKISYPAVFHKENDSYWVEFPDLPGCFSDGNTIEDAFYQAKEALGLYLEHKDALFKLKIKQPTSYEVVANQYNNNRVLRIEYDSIEFGKKYKSKAIKKTLSIPEWLNEEAERNNISFSQVLQDALIEKLNLK